MKRQNDLLVWDEPAASLDPLAEASLFDQILALRGQVRSASHLLGTARRLAYYLGFLFFVVDSAVHNTSIQRLFEDGPDPALREGQAC
jgi:ABC-type transporter Mla maintaining outer membrane lipid asymmetry ATPase subunit MlaF